MSSPFRTPPANKAASSVLERSSWTWSANARCDHVSENRCGPMRQSRTQIAGRSGSMFVACTAPGGCGFAVYRAAMPNHRCGRTKYTHKSPTGLHCFLAEFWDSLAEADQARRMEQRVFVRGRCLLVQRNLSYPYW